MSENPPKIKFPELEERESKRKVGIVVLGRGVGKNPVTGELEPTDFLEAAVVKDPSKGDFGPEQHPEVNVPVDPAHEPSNSRYAGAKANVEATRVLIERLAEDPGRELTMICLAAGRTPDMKDYAPVGWTQGMVLAKSILEDKDTAEKLEKAGVKMVFEPDNVNTWDDIVASFIALQEAGCDEVMVVTVSPHLERTDLMVREAVSGMEHVYGEDRVFEIRMVPSELLLINDEEQFGKMHASMFKGESIRRTKGLRITEEREENGIKQMKSGNYKSQWSDGGRVAEFDKPVEVMSVSEVRNFK